RRGRARVAARAAARARCERAHGAARSLPLVRGDGQGGGAARVRRVRAARAALALAVRALPALPRALRRSLVVLAAGGPAPRADGASRAARPGAGGVSRVPVRAVSVRPPVVAAEALRERARRAAVRRSAVL